MAKIVVSIECNKAHLGYKEQRVKKILQPRECSSITSAPYGGWSTFADDAHAVKGGQNQDIIKSIDQDYISKVFRVVSAPLQDKPCIVLYCTFLQLVWYCIECQKPVLIIFQLKSSSFHLGI